MRQIETDRRRWASFDSAPISLFFLFFLFDLFDPIATMTLRAVKIILAWLAFAAAAEQAVSVAWILHKGRIPEQSPAADAAIVLGAAAYAAAPSPVFEQRLRRGAELYREGKTPKIIVAGGTPKADYPTESEIGAKWLTRRGVRPQDILQESRSLDTIENLRNAQAMMRKLGLKSAAIVSDPYHMARVSMIADNLGMDYKLCPTPTSKFTQGDLVKKYKFLAKEGAYLAPFRLSLTIHPLSA